MKKILLLLFLLITFNVNADTGIFTYQPPTERENNTPLLQSEISGYNVYINNIKNTEISPLLSTTTGFTLTLLPGEYNVEVTTLDTDNRESKRSVPVNLKVPFNPNPPSNVTVSITININ